MMGLEPTTFPWQAAQTVTPFRSVRAARTRRITVYLDRALGKAALPTQGGRHDVTRSEAVAIAREEHALKMDAEVPAAREMLARLVERRAQEIAAGNGTADRLIPHDVSD